MNPLGSPREALYRVGLRVLHRMAHRYWRRFGGCVELDELVSVGLPAVTDAVRRYDARRGLFRPYLVQRLRWTFLDQVRKRMRRRLDPERGVPLVVARVAADSQPREGEEAPPAGDPAELALAEDAGPESWALRRDRTRVIQRALDQLPPRKQILIMRHYFRGQLLQEIAADFAVSISTISRLHREAIAALEAYLRGSAEDEMALS